MNTSPYRIVSGENYLEQRTIVLKRRSDLLTPLKQIHKSCRHHNSLRESSNRKGRCNPLQTDYPHSPFRLSKMVIWYSFLFPQAIGQLVTVARNTTRFVKEAPQLLPTLLRLQPQLLKAVAPSSGQSLIQRSEVTLTPVAPHKKVLFQKWKHIGQCFFTWWKLLFLCLTHSVTVSSVTGKPPGKRQGDSASQWEAI